MHRALRRIARTSLVAFLAASLVGVSAPAASAAVEEVSGFAQGSVHPVFNAPGAPLHGHFYYRFTSADHHLKRIAALPEAFGSIQIAFHDQDSDDEYFYRVAHQRVFIAGLSLGAISGTCVGRCDQAISRPADDYVLVLTGFRFAYTDPDHHVDEILVQESGGRLYVAFNDQNDDDTFDWRVSYAWVPRASFSMVSQASGSILAGPWVRQDVPPGNKVIRGFYVNYLRLEGDNHIKEFGVITNSASIEVYYADKDGYDSGPWSYSVEYAILT